MKKQHFLDPNFLRVFSNFLKMYFLKTATSNDHISANFQPILIFFFLLRSEKGPLFKKSKLRIFFADFSCGSSNCFTYEGINYSTPNMDYGTWKNSELVPLGVRGRGIGERKNMKHVKTLERTKPSFINVIRWIKSES